MASLNRQQTERMVLRYLMATDASIDTVEEINKAEQFVRALPEFELQSVAHHVSSDPQNAQMYSDVPEATVPMPGAATSGNLAVGISGAAHGAARAAGDWAQHPSLPSIPLPEVTFPDTPPGRQGSMIESSPWRVAAGGQPRVVPTGRRSPEFDQTVSRHAGDLANDPNFLNTVAAIAAQESGFNRSPVGDNGTSHGWFQMHQGGALTGAGYTPAQANDLEAASRYMVPQYADAYRQISGAHPDWTPDRIANAVAVQVQRPADAATTAYGARFSELGSAPRDPADLGGPFVQPPAATAPTARDEYRSAMGNLTRSYTDFLKEPTRAGWGDFLAKYGITASALANQDFPAMDPNTGKSAAQQQSELMKGMHDTYYEPAAQRFADSQKGVLTTKDMIELGISQGHLDLARDEAGRKGRNDEISNQIAQGQFDLALRGEARGVTADETRNTGMYRDENGDMVPTRSAFESDRNYQRLVDQERQNLRRQMANDFVSQFSRHAESLVTLRAQAMKEAEEQSLRRPYAGSPGYVRDYEPGGFMEQMARLSGQSFTPRDIATYGVPAQDPYRNMNEYQQMMEPLLNRMAGGDYRNPSIFEGLYGQ